MGLNEFLNVVIPILIFIFFAAVIYRAFQDPLDTLFGKIKELFGETKEVASPENIWGCDLEYK